MGFSKDTNGLLDSKSYHKRKKKKIKATFSS